MGSRRAQLLSLGVRLFARRSYGDVSIDDIAREAEVSKGLLYHYFGGKRAFYVAVVGEAARRLLDAIEPDASLPPPARAFVGIEAYLTFVEQRADTYRALVTGGLGTDPEISALLTSARHQIADRILDAIGLRGEHPSFQIAVRSWIGGVETACIEWLSDRTLPREQFVRLMLGSLQGALASANAIDPVDGLLIELPELVGPVAPIVRPSAPSDD